MSAFKQMMQKTRDRNWGGTSQSVACEPYISGYSFIAWNIPTILTQMIGLQGGFGLESMGNSNDMTDTEENDTGSVLSAAMMAVTPPGGTLNKVQFQGLGGSKWSVPGSIDYGNTISIKYTEFSGLPIHRIHRAWCNAIRDNKIGLTALSNNGLISGKYNKANYSATLLYWTTKPDGVTVEYYAAYSGVFPLKDPMDVFSGDINSVDKLEIDIDYNVDMVYHEDWVYELIQNITSKSAPYGAPASTLWSKDGFRDMQQATTAIQMSNNL
jgi:hypothetical protein